MSQIVSEKFDKNHHKANNISINTKKHSSKIANGSNRRYRTSFEQDQLISLEKIFEKTHYPDAYLREEIATQIGLSEAKVQVKFQL